jgi:preprotein translocase subunit YajC
MKTVAKLRETGLVFFFFFFFFRNHTRRNNTTKNFLTGQRYMPHKAASYHRKYPRRHFTAPAHNYIYIYIYIYIIYILLYFMLKPDHTKNNDISKATYNVPN